MINSPLTTHSSKGKMMTADDLVTLHHQMMICYGWISVEEFSNLPLPTLLQFKPFIEEELVKREQIRLSTMSAGGVKNPK